MGRSQRLGKDSARTQFRAQFLLGLSISQGRELPNLESIRCCVGAAGVGDITLHEHHSSPTKPENIDVKLYPAAQPCPRQLETRNTKKFLGPKGFKLGLKMTQHRKVLTMQAW